jgi:cardiolipin synthase A/B
MDTQRSSALPLAVPGFLLPLRPRIRAVIAAGLLGVLAASLGGCAAPGSAGALPLEVQRLLLELPDAAYYRDGQLVLHYGSGDDQTVLAAAWPVGDLNPARQNLRMAVLEFLPEPPADPADLQLEWQPVVLFGHPQWQALVRAVLEHIAPEHPGSATLVSLQHADFVLDRDRAGMLRLLRMEDKPAALPIGQRVSEEAFTALAHDHLQRELSGYPEGSGPVLFAVGGDEPGGSFVLFDFVDRQSVFITPLPAASPPDRPLDFSLRVIDAVTVRSHLFGVLRQPVTLVHRLLWRATHAGAAMLPRGTSASNGAPALTAGLPMDPEQWEQRLDALVGTDQYRGSMDLLIDGEAFFESLIEAILEAQESIDIRLYIFDRDDYALRIADLLKRRSHQVRVRVLVDRLGALVAGRVPAGSPYHSRDESQLFIADYLRQDSKVEVRVVDNPWFTSDHTKVIVIDRKRAYVGGMNIGHEYRYVWHDLMVELSGPIVGRLAKDFDKRWAHTGLGGDLAFAIAATKRERHAGDMDGPDFMNIRPLYTRTGDAQILRAQLAAIRAAQSRIYIQQPYVSDDQLVAELIRARQRGVDVRVILPTRCDSGLMDSTNLIAARAFMQNGIRVYLYPGMTHVKAALYDGWAIVGSANFDKLSLRINQETNLATSDPRFVAQLERELFEVDFARAKELAEIEPVGWRDYIAKLIAEQL